MLRNFLNREKEKEHHRSEPSAFSQLRSRLHHTPSTRKSSRRIKIVKMSTPDVPEDLVIINRPQKVYTGEYRSRAGPLKVESSLAPIQEEGAKEERLTMREASVQIARVAKELDDGWDGLREYMCELEQKAAEERERALAQETEEASS